MSKTQVATSVDFSQIPTPCFVLEEKLLRKNLELLKYVQVQAGCNIILALKGFSMYSAFGLIKNYLAGATSSSLNEARLINEFMHQKAHIYSPAYLEREFDEIMLCSSHITFNSLSQFDKFKHRVANHSEKISCGIRINPQYSEVATEMYDPCVPGSRLGITRDQIGDTLPEGIEGIHFHTLCENNSDVLERTIEAIELRFGDLLHQAKWINMGGGHLITRDDYDVERLIGLIKRIREKYNIEVTLEPGSAIGWRTGYLTASVQDIMESQGIKVAVIDVSFAAHMPDTLEMPYKPRIHGVYSDPVPGKPTYRLGGMTCLAGDFMGDYSFDEPLEVGDTLVFDDMMHYTMVKTTTFNGVGLPSIGIWKENNTFELVREYGYESFKDRLS